jgi:iron complex transport system ATP-binding protein
MPAMVARNVGFSYRRPIVEDFSLTLQSGTLTGLIGPNGCGKTTVLNLLDGILEPQSGEVLLDGTRPLAGLRRKEIARHIAMVPQNAGIPAYQTVLQCVLQGRSPYLSILGFESDGDERVAREALDLTLLSGFADTPLSEVSGGEKQRVLLARAIAQQTPILLLDEFTANLDINYQVELMRLVARISRERGVATLVVSHEINLLAAFADRLVLMAGGQVTAQGDTSEVATPENLGRLFGVEFAVRAQPGGATEVIPQFRNGRTK